MTNLLAYLIVFISSYSIAATLRPFCTDGCSVVGNRNMTSYICCVHHDLAYWGGGSRSDRFAADGRFYQCLLKTEGAVIAETYATAVAMYGEDYWGLDWEGRPRFQSLSPSERQMVEDLTPMNPYVVPCGEDSTRRAISIPVGKQ